MPKRTVQDQIFRHPEEQLKYLSMTEDIEGVYEQPQKNNHKWDIQPWKNQHENPSQSPQRRPYMPRPTPASSKSQKPLQLKLLKSSARILEPASCNNTFRVKPSSKRNSTIVQNKIQSQNNRPQSRLFTQATRKQSINSNTKIIRRQSLKRKQEEQEDYTTFHSPVNLILYPMVTEPHRKRLFRKMDKFQNFVSVSLRK